MGATIRYVFRFSGKIVNDLISFLVFSVFDILDILLCYVYKVVDYFVEDEWKPCYCSSPEKAIINGGNILVSENGEAEKIVCVTSTKVEFEEISGTLYSRPSLVAEVSKTSFKRRNVRSSSFKVEMAQEKIGGHKSHAVRWSDCDCETCNAWSNSCKDTLFVHAEGRKGW